MTLPFTELLTRYCLLVGRLPARGGKVTTVTCSKCGNWAGCVANRAGILVGQFEPDIRHDDGIVSIATMLVHAVLIDGRNVRLKCMQCGYVTRWHR